MILAFMLLTLASPFIFLVNTLRRVTNKDRLSRYFYNIAIGLDQLGGCLLYNQVDWTISSWTYIQSQKHKEHYYFMRFIDFFFGKDHCYNSFLNETKVHKQGVDNV